MDTRQLTAFCAVVERRSFSQAAERLGVTQPAVSLQVRALEKRLGLQLLDRSGRRVEPTEAGWRLYRGAQRLLQLEAQVLDEVSAESEGELAGTLSSPNVIPLFGSRSRCTTPRPSSSSSQIVSSSWASLAPPDDTERCGSSRLPTMR
jgi:DNA-binding transcriptional LysR family regulator